jgi:glycosyltransferase involved in cell wall biosynthesis
MLWSGGKEINLVIVGKQGWMVEELAEKLRAHPQMNHQLFWLEGISDEYLEQLYAAASCLMLPSQGEGFGLPLIEAAQHKLPIIARDLPVFREVAGEYAYYFTNDTHPLILTKAIEEWIELYQNDNHPKSDDMPWLTWKQSAKMLLKLLNRDNRRD